MENEKYEYKTNNKSYKKMAKLYPFNGYIFSNIYFHIIVPDYSIHEICDLLMEYYERYVSTPGHTCSDYERIKEIQACVDGYMDDDDRMFDDYSLRDEDELLDNLYDEYIECIYDYIEVELGSDEVYSLKMACITGDKTYDDVMNETDRDKYHLLVVGIRYSNSIDEKIFSKYKKAISEDYNFSNAFDEIRKSNLDFVTHAINDGENLLSSIKDTVVHIIIKYILNYALYYVPLKEDKVIIDFNEYGKVTIVTNIEGSLNINAFKLKSNVNSYDVDTYKFDNLLDITYEKVIKFTNAYNLLYKPEKRVELFKYDNGTKSCLFIKNDVGCTYLFLDGFKFEDSKEDLKKESLTKKDDIKKSNNKEKKKK